jgi:site-specific recombinase XerD
MGRFPPHPLTKLQAIRLIAVADDGTKLGARTAAICVLLYRTGMRCNELCSMEIEDVYPLEDGCAVIRIRNPKGFKGGAMPREVGLDRRAARYIFEWMVARGTQPGPLFPTGTGRKLHPSYFRQLLPMLAKRGGINRRVHAHAFRHTFAREMYDEGTGLMEIMLALGHTSLATTQKYLRSIGATEVVATTTKRSW